MDFSLDEDYFVHQTTADFREQACEFGVDSYRMDQGNYYDLGANTPNMSQSSFQEFGSGFFDGLVSPFSVLETGANMLFGNGEFSLASLTGQVGGAIANMALMRYVNALKPTVGPLLNMAKNSGVGQKTAQVAKNVFSNLNKNNTKNGVNVGKQIWSSTNKKTSVQNAFKHWKDHKDEFPELYNSKQYVEKAHSLLQCSEQTLTKFRPNGEILRYQTTSNTFGAFTKDGAPKTMFRPRDGIHYWETRN
jgi:hypothetical protein